MKVCVIATPFLCALWKSRTHSVATHLLSLMKQIPPKGVMTAAHAHDG